MALENPVKRGAVLITGTSTGIGRACALHLDRKGFKVFAGVRKVEDGNALKLESSEKLTPIIIDVSDNDSIKEAAREITKTVCKDGLSGLVNNAGIVVSGPLEFLPIEDMWRQLHVNLVGHLAVMQSFLPLLRIGKGRIVNVTSIGGRQSVPFMGPYCASKAAMEAISDSLRMELRKWNIPVSIVTPGTVITPIWEKSQKIARDKSQSFPMDEIELYGTDFEKVLNAPAKVQKMGVLPEKVAKVIAHILAVKKPKSRYIVGLDAKIQIMMTKLVPDSVRDRMVLWFLGL